MTKNELLTKVQEIALEGEVKISKKDLVVVTDALYAAILDGVKAGEKVKFGEVTYSAKHVDTRTGVSKLGDTPKEWRVEAHDEVAVKPSKKLKYALA